MNSRRETAAFLLVKARSLPAGLCLMPSGIKRSPRSLIERAAAYLMASEPYHAGHNPYHWGIHQKPTRNMKDRALARERRLNGELDASCRNTEKVLPMQHS
jgi:hypothetical protein